MIYSIEVGKWTGAFAFAWYADVFSSEDRHRIATFSGLSKKSVRNKAARYIRRLHRDGSGSHRDVTVYSYDAKTHLLQEIPMSSKPAAATDDVTEPVASPLSR